MKPVLILQHLSADGPGFLATWLAGRGQPFAVFDNEAGQHFPERIDGWRALAVLGGEMSANDALPSLRRAEDLIRAAAAAAVPTLGICLGGQLMARTLGARVADAPAPEIGWQPLQVLDNAAARAWFGEPGPRRVFQWHYEAFDLPAGAQRLAASEVCPNQAYAIGPHLGLQFHIEIDAEKIGRWSRDEDPRYRCAQAAHATVQDGAAMRDGMAAWLAPQQALAARLFERWLGTAPD